MSDLSGKHDQKNGPLGGGASTKNPYDVSGGSCQLGNDAGQAPEEVELVETEAAAADSSRTGCTGEVRPAPPGGLLALVLIGRGGRDIFVLCLWGLRQKNLKNNFEQR